jgi:hypothetical protein
MIKLKDLLKESNLLNEVGAFYGNDDSFIDYIYKSMEKENLPPLKLSSAGNMNTGALSLHNANGYSIYINYGSNNDHGIELNKYKIVVGLSKSSDPAPRNFLKKTFRGFDSMADAKKYAAELFKEHWPVILRKKTIKDLGYTKKK